ncbi:MAG TPA: cob(I)yrinic acid a,c-diamide adenosyltransferase [Candidatus Didemnitutus sp.]|nr:cob(I)yrinic acid a,c-diamide adenosyltransferase [Candidatus Didemnitutus sp.]
MPAVSKSRARSIATRTGDDGRTALLFGRRVPKDHPRIEAVGAIDELNAALGLAKAVGRSARLRRGLERVQKELVVLMGEVACAPAGLPRYQQSKLPKFSESWVKVLDAEIEAIERRLPAFAGWAIPGANPLAAALDLARTTARRAERRLVTVKARPTLLQHINRLSDWLWLQARDTEAVSSRRRPTRR